VLSRLLFLAFLFSCLAALLAEAGNNERSQSFRRGPTKCEAPIVWVFNNRTCDAECHVTLTTVAPFTLFGIDDTDLVEYGDRYNRWAGPGETNGGAADTLEFCYTSDDEIEWQVEYAGTFHVQGDGYVGLLAIHEDSQGGTQSQFEPGSSSNIRHNGFATSHLNAGIIRQHGMQFARGECLALTGTQFPAASITHFGIESLALMLTQEGCI